jgi:autotransporter-associated beta strand protein
LLTNNVRFTTTPASLDSDTTGINSLVLDSATGVTLNGAAQSFQITSGAILSASAGASVIGGFAGITNGTALPYYVYVTNSAGSLTLNSPLTSNVPLVKSGAGTLVLTNSAGSFTDLYFNQGTVQVDAIGELGSGALDFFGGTLKFTTGFDPSSKTITFGTGGGTFDTASDITIANSIGNSGSGSFTKAGAGNLTLNTPVNYSGRTIVNGGTLTYGVAAALPSTTGLTLGGGTLNEGGFTTMLADLMVTASSTISGSAPLTFTGNVEIDGGAARTLTDNNSGLTSFTGNTWTLVNSGTTARITTLAGTGSMSIANQINDGTAAGSLTITNTGTTTLSGANFYSGTTILNAAAGILVLSGSNGSAGATTLTTGTIRFNSDSNGGLASGLLTLTAGTLQALNAPRTISNAITFTAATVSGSQNLTFTGKLTGLTGGSRTLTSSITGGTLTLGDVDINTETANARTLTIAGTGATTITGVIANGNASKANGLTVTNTNTTTLAGNSTYTGTTLISAGKVVVSGSLSGAVTVSASTTLAGGNNRLTQLGSQVAAITSSGTVSPGDSGSTADLSTIGQLNATGNVGLTAGSLKLEIGGNQDGVGASGSETAGSLQYDRLNLSGGTLTLGSALNLSSVNGQTYTSATMTGGLFNTDGHIFFLITGASTVTGTFSNQGAVGSDSRLPAFATIFNADGQEFALSYHASFASGSLTGGNDVAIMAVPEPGSISLLAASIGLALGVQRLRRRR